MKVLEMTTNLFEFRKRVMNHLYEARDLLQQDLPRIKVRIVEFEKYQDKQVMGRCFIDKNYVKILLRRAKTSSGQLYGMNSLMRISTLNMTLNALDAPLCRRSKGFEP